MDTKAWGPGGWVFLHCIAFNYPEKPTLSQKIAYKTFFESIGNVLPCKYCRESYKVFLKKHPIDHYIGSGKELSFWLYGIHCLVNDKLRNQGNPVPPNPSFESVCQRYQRYVAKCNDRTMKCTAPRNTFHPGTLPPSVSRKMREEENHFENDYPPEDAYGRGYRR